MYAVIKMGQIERRGFKTIQLAHNWIDATYGKNSYARVIEEPVEVMYPFVFTADDIQPKDWDKALVKAVFREEYRGHLITGTLSRMGGLTVLAMPLHVENGPLFHGDNILVARKWVDHQIKLLKEVEA